ncbi:MAG: M48 family metalloprotease [Paracoccaceae bacterium]
MHPARALIAAIACLAVLAAPLQAASVGLLRDSDIEGALDRLARPVLLAAGLSPARVRVLVVNDSGLNAFVADSRHILITQGLLLKMTGAAQLQGVIAHEAAHIANGHLTRRAANMNAMRTAAGLGIALAAAAAAAGADSRAASGLAVGAASSSLRRFLTHTRAEESSADQSAIRYLAQAGVDPRGLVEVMEIFEGQEVLAAHRQDPYLRTHPLSRDRLRALRGHVAAYRREAGPDPDAEYWFARAQGKLSAFLRAPAWTMRRAADSPTEDIRLMREAVAQHRRSNLGAAIEAIDGALALRPGDAALTDLKGQILLESRRFPAAVATYAQAVNRAPDDALILGGYGRALLAAGRPADALGPLERARARDMGDARVLRDLAQAYARTGQTPMASVVTAERYALMGRLDDAALHARRALDTLPRGSGPWQRAQDVLSAADRAE